MAYLPAAPYFQCYPKEHSIDLCDTVHTRQRVSHVALLDGFDLGSIVYDSKGLAWRFSFERPAARLSVLRRLLAHTIYNPVREVAVSWFRLHEYSFAELRDAYLDAIAHDDDVLTQFVEASDLQRRVQESQSFGDLVETWRWMDTDHTT